MKEFWDARYSDTEYVYGKQPNSFLKSELTKLKKGRVLLPAEGEGRNAVCAAKLGWKVDAFDYSNSARLKAESLADEFKVEINYSNSSIEDFDPGHIAYDCIALIYFHLPKNEITIAHQKLIKYLVPGGKLILEGFSKKQIDKTSGGPKNVDMLFSKEKLEEDFSSLDIDSVEEVEIFLNEGEFHKGEASIIRIIATKPAS